MDLVICEYCEVRVVPSINGTCPSCRRVLAGSSSDSGNVPNVEAANSHARRDAPTESVERNSSGMTTGEKVYSAVVIICAGFTLISLASFHFVIIPGTENPGVFYFVASIIWLTFMSLAVTVAANLLQQKLLVVPTIIQSVVLCCMVYFIPVGIAGFILLRNRLRRESRNLRQSDE
jgi:pheromone shutdown protein TraB